jgi:hypothetical protein
MSILPRIETELNTLAGKARGVELIRELFGGTMVCGGVFYVCCTMGGSDGHKARYPHRGVRSWPLFVRLWADRYAYAQLSHVHGDPYLNTPTADTITDLGSYLDANR